MRHVDAKAFHFGFRKRYLGSAMPLDIFSILRPSTEGLPSRSAPKLCRDNLRGNYVFSIIKEVQRELVDFTLGTEIDFDPIGGMG